MIRSTLVRRCLVLVVLLLVGSGACRREAPPAVATPAEEVGEVAVRSAPNAVGDGDHDEGKLVWMPEDEHARLLAIEAQFGGFSQTMTEISYRFVELYFAGQDENWEYADYQLEHIEEALEAGIVRRPERAGSAQGFLQRDAVAMREAIEARDRARFDAGFEGFRQACNTCHAMEQVPFINVVTPQVRAAAVGKPSPAAR